MTPILVIPGISDPATLACIARSRRYGQYVKAVENALAGVCPFCTVDRTYNQVIAENEHWYAWPCRPAENHTFFHILFVPKRHVKDSEELSDEETMALWGHGGIRREVRQMHGYKSRGTLMRDGDATLSAGTIQHLHIHDMVLAGTGRVESPFYKGLESEHEGIRRAQVFEKLRTGTLVHELTPEEHDLVTGRVS